MDTDSSFPDTRCYGNGRSRRHVAQQTFCQGGDNLQPADCVLLPLQAGAARLLLYSLGTMTLFCGLRSMQDLVVMSYMVLAWLIVWKFLTRV